MNEKIENRAGERAEIIRKLKAAEASAEAEVARTMVRENLKALIAMVAIALLVALVTAAGWSWEVGEASFVLCLVMAALGWWLGRVRDGR